MMARCTLERRYAAVGLGPVLDLQFLGPVRATSASGVLDLGGPKEHTLLALLATSGGRVSRDRLIDDLWDGSPPATARKTLQTYVWRLRTALPAGAVAMVAGGYELRHAVDTDVARFERLIREGDGALGANDVERARSAFRRGSEMWRGEPFAGCAPSRALQAYSIKLHELLARAVEGRIEADLRAGEHAMVVAELEEQVGATPFRERLWEMLIVALYRSGRQADALVACRRARRVLLDELGVEPGPALSELERAVLEQRPDLAAPPVRLREEPSPSAPATWGDGRLPLPTTRLVGRTAERQTVLRLLGDHRLVTVTGVGGTGKTRLALAVGLELSTTDDVRFCDLAVVSTGGGVVDALARASGVTAHRLAGASRTDADALAVVVDELRNVARLIVLDNCEHVIDACVEIAGRVLTDCPDVRLLATSREPLGVVGEQTYVLAPLRVPVDDDDVSADAVTLFVERAVQARSTFEVTSGNRASIAEICRRLDGLPLALELAAARLSHLSLIEVVERLDHRFALLTASGRARPDRHRTLHATLEWSYDLLPADEQALFARLSVFAGSFTLAAVHGCCTTERDEQCAIDLLRGLVDRSLVVVEHRGPATRFRLLQTVRAFAATKLDEQDTGEATRAAHAQWFLDRLDELPWDDRLLGVGLAERLTDEHDDLLRALAWAVAAHREDLVARLATSMATLLFTHVDAGQLRRWFAIAVDFERTRPLAQRFATTVASFHLLGRWDGDVASLEVHRARLQELAPHLPSHHAVTSLAWSALASLSSRLDNHRPAMEACADRGLEHAPADGHRLQAMARCQKARALLFQERYAEAISVLNAGLGSAHDDGHYSVHQDLVLALHLAGEHSQAVSLAAWRLEHLPASPFETRITSIYGALAAAAAGDGVRARTFLDLALASQDTHPHPCGATDCLMAAAAISFLDGRPITASAVLARLDESSVSVNAFAVLLQHYQNRTRDAVPPEVWREAVASSTELPVLRGAGLI